MDCYYKVEKYKNLDERYRIRTSVKRMIEWAVSTSKKRISRHTHLRFLVLCHEHKIKSILQNKQKTFQGCYNNFEVLIQTTRKHKNEVICEEALFRNIPNLFSKNSRKQHTYMICEEETVNVASVTSTVGALVGHIKTLDCSSVSDAADREGGLKTTQLTQTPHSLYWSYNVCIHSRTVKAAAQSD